MSQTQIRLNFTLKSFKYYRFTGFHIIEFNNRSTKDTLQKQPSRGVIKKSCSENMQQIYRRTPMPKCDFNKVALELYWNCTSKWVLSCKFAVSFQTLFLRTPLDCCFWYFSSFIGLSVLLMYTKLFINFRNGTNWTILVAYLNHFYENWKNQLFLQVSNSF